MTQPVGVGAVEEKGPVVASFGIQSMLHDDVVSHRRRNVRMPRQSSKNRHHHETSSTAAERWAQVMG